mmetsp:Transcript_38773/g.76831  ORF Transcript_38773/g.76831 Transcript_38773/m.76831 type:complete len:846 (-) Transcript_38773:60-2597(-)
MVDHRVDLLNAVTEGPSAFSAVSDTYGSAPDYFQTMATNVKAELTAAFQQGVNGNGATLSFVLARDTWVLPEGRLEAVRSLKGCVIQDTKTKDVFWIKKSHCSDTAVAQSITRSFFLEGFNASGNLKALKSCARDARIAVFAADYAARYSAACQGADNVVCKDLLRMVLKPCQKSGRPGSFVEANPGAELQLNDCQRDAVLGLERRLEIIHGPPGTGKSTTILGMLKTRIPPSRTSCVTCVTNQALEAVSGKLQHSFTELPFIILGNVENLGAVSKAFVLEEQVCRADSLAQARRALVECRKAIDEAMRLREEATDPRTQSLWDVKLGNLRAQRDICQTELEKVNEVEARRIVRRSKVFLCTTASLHRISALKEEYGEHFPGSPHTVVLDEAGATPESYIPQVLHTGTENLILLGDHKQLPPLVITMDLSDVEHKRVNQSLMERAVKGMPEAWVHQLNEQYRMPAVLCQLVSTLFYENRLLTAAARAAVPQTGPVLQWLRVQEPENSVGTSKVNLGEAAVIVDWLRRRAPLAKSRGETVKCITFYKLQRDLIQNCFANDPDTAAMVVSVDASQGSESDHILLSTVRSNAKGDVGFCADPRRLCVAISRAKATLTIVGDPSCMCSGPWGKIVNVVKQSPVPIEVGAQAEVRNAFEVMRRASTRPCRFFLMGGCTNKECSFLHDLAPEAEAEALRALRSDAKPCTFFAQGRCTKGKDCTFSHDFDKDDPLVEAELRQSQSARDPCQYHQQGKCKKGLACPFSHDFRPGDRKIAAQIRQSAEPCSFFRQGRCKQGAACTFSHNSGHSNAFEASRSKGKGSSEHLPPASKGKSGKSHGKGKSKSNSGWY